MHAVVDLLLPDAGNADSPDVISWYARIRTSGETKGSWCTLRTSVVTIGYTHCQMVGQRSIPSHHFITNTRLQVPGPGSRARSPRARVTP